jgi:hypothetical protein
VLEKVGHSSCSGGGDSTGLLEDRDIPPTRSPFAGARGAHGSAARPPLHLKPLLLGMRADEAAPQLGEGERKPKLAEGQC